MTGPPVPGPPGTWPVARLLAERQAAQLLSGPPAATAEAVAGRLLAIQGQDPRGARLAIRARSQGLTAADVDHALTVDRSLVIGWLNRGTLHLVRSADYWALHRLTTPPLAAGVQRRLAQEGIGPAEADRGVVTIERALTTHGPQTRAQLAGLLASAGLRTHGQAVVFLLYLASLRGIAVRGPMAGRQHAYVLAHDWLGAPPAAGQGGAGRHGAGRPGAGRHGAGRDEAGRDEAGRAGALAWLARRYLAGHGPATAHDLAKWAGLPLRDARAGLAGIGAGLRDRGGGLVSLTGPGTGPPGPGAAPPTRLLGSFDPVLHGWQSRADVLGPHEPAIVRGGMFRPFAMVRGRAVGTWGLAGRTVTLDLLEPLDQGDETQLRSDAADVERFLGLAGTAA